MSVFDVRMFGGASVHGPDGVLDELSPRHQALALLSVLVTSPRPVGRDRLIALLWPESDTRRARNSLNVTVHELRTVLGRDAILSVNDDLRLNGQVVTSDVARFRQAVQIREWQRAVELYIGPLLDGFHLRDRYEYDEWIRGQRDEFTRQYRSALESLAAAAETDGDLQAAIGYWERLMAEDLSSARATVRLMLALEANGERGRALERAQAHTRFMRDGFDADPDPDVEALEKRLRDTPATGHNGLDQRLESHLASLSSSHRAGESVWTRGFRIKPVVLLVAGAVALLLLCTESVRYEPERVVVLPFENRTGDGDLDALGFVVSDWITQGLASSGFIQPVSSSVVMRAVQTESEVDALALAEELGAGVVVTGSYSQEADSVILRGQIVELPTKKTLRSIERVAGPVGATEGAIDVLRQRAIGALVTHYDPRLVSWAQAASQPPNLDAYLRFSVGLDHLLRGELAESLEPLHEASALDPSFTAPLLWALFAHQRKGQWAVADSILSVLDAARPGMAPWDRAMLDYYTARQHGDRVAAYEAMKRVTRITPDSEWLYRLGSEALHLNRPREAIDILSSLEPRGWLSTWWDYWYVLSGAHHVLGEHQAELEVVRRGQQRFPEELFLAEARALIGLGEIDAVEKLITRAHEKRPWVLAYMGELIMELRAHDHQEAVDRIVELVAPWFTSDALDAENPMLHESRGALFYAAQRWDESRPHYEWFADLGRPDPDHRGRLAVIALKQGDREAVIRADRWMQEFGSQAYNTPGQYTLWRARFAAQVGDSSRAVTLLRQAHGEGVSMNPEYRHVDPDFASLWDYEPFVELLRPKG